MTCSDCSPRGPVDRPRREAAAWGAAAGQFANFATNLADFNLLVANFGQSPRDVTQGDFNYDGRVNLQGFNVRLDRRCTSGRVPTAGATTNLEHLMRNQD